MQSSGGRDIRGAIQAWAIQQERLDDARKARDRADAFLDQFIMFFRFDGDLYATDDAGRRTFYDMKNGSMEGDEPLPKGYKGFAAFSAVDLKEAMRGGGGTVKFRAEDLDEIEVISRNEAADMLSSVGKKKTASKMPDPDTEGEMPGGQHLPED